MKKTNHLIMTSALMLATSTTAMGYGFGMFTHGTSALGQSNAVVAHPAGPSTVYFNPAMHNEIDGRQI